MENAFFRYKSIIWRWSGRVSAGCAGSPAAGGRWRRASSHGRAKVIVTVMATGTASPSTRVGSYRQLLDGGDRRRVEFRHRTQHLDVDHLARRTDGRFEDDEALDPERPRRRRIDREHVVDLARRRHPVADPGSPRPSVRALRRARFGARHWHTRSTSARHRIRHGIRHTAARAGRRSCPCVANGRLRHMLIGYARVSKADGSPVAGPAARRAAGRWRRRRPRLPRLRVPASATIARGSTAACARSGRATQQMMGGALTESASVSDRRSTCLKRCCGDPVSS